MLTAEALARLKQRSLPMPAAAGVFCASLGPLAAGDSTVLAAPLSGFKLPPSNGRRMAAPPMSYLAKVSPDDPLAYPLT
jgi:hypothetical protein